MLMADWILAMLTVFNRSRTLMQDKREGLCPHQEVHCAQFLQDCVCCILHSAGVSSFKFSGELHIPGPTATTSLHVLRPASCGMCNLSVMLTS